MFDSNLLDEAIDAVVEELVDSRQCIVTMPSQFEARVLELAMAHDKGVINIMGHLSQRVEVCPRFNPVRKEQILNQLTLRGVGVAQPVLRCY